MKPKRIFYKIVSPLRTTYWFIFRPKTQGVKMLIEYNNKFLMIRNTYGHKQWTFPGGGVKRGETTEAAVKREVEEEVNVSVAGLFYLGDYYHTRQYKKDTVHCFYAKVNSPQYRIDNSEIEQARWFTFQDMPKIRAASVQSVLHLYKNPQHYPEAAIKHCNTRFESSLK